MSVFKNFENQKFPNNPNIFCPRTYPCLGDLSLTAEGAYAPEA